MNLQETKHPQPVHVAHHGTHASWIICLQIRMTGVTPSNNATMASSPPLLMNVVTIIIEPHLKLFKSYLLFRTMQLKLPSMTPRNSVGHLLRHPTSTLYVCPTKVNVKSRRHPLITTNVAHASFMSMLIKFDTFSKTTQHATNVMSGHIITQTIQSPHPAQNVWHCHEPVASDTIYSEVPAVNTNG